MGTDIHSVVQRKVNGIWQLEKVPPELQSEYRNGTGNAYDQWMYNYRAYDERHYDVFAVLADVRNGTGFAGVLTGYPVPPISEPRGLPDDFECKCPRYTDDEYPDDEDDSSSEYSQWAMGEHSFSWVTLRELMEYPWQTGRIKVGVISLTEFAVRVQLNITERPEDYCGMISGQGIKVLSEAEAIQVLRDPSPTVDGNKTYVQITWNQPIISEDDTLLADWIPWMKTLDENPDNVRMVFGFDS